MSANGNSAETIPLLINLKARGKELSEHQIMKIVTGIAEGTVDESQLGKVNFLVCLLACHSKILAGYTRLIMTGKILMFAVCLIVLNTRGTQEIKMP